MSNTRWLHKTYYLETLKVYARVWDIYIKFYTVFLTANVVGIGLVAKDIHGNRMPIIVSFSILNFILIGTSVWMARYSTDTDKKLREVGNYLMALDSVEGTGAGVIKDSPVALRLSQWAGYANCAASACMIGCWISLKYIAL